VAAPATSHPWGRLMIPRLGHPAGRTRLPNRPSAAASRAVPRPRCPPLPKKQCGPS